MNTVTQFNPILVVAQNPPMDTLATFHVDPVNGFLPAQDPVKRLPAYYAAWEQALFDLPMGLTVNKARVGLRSLPTLPINRLETEGEKERAMLLLSMFASACVWEEATPQTLIPQNVAQPLCALAETLDRPPMLSYTSIVLHNWRRLHQADLMSGDDPTSSHALQLEDLALLHSFGGGMDEQWFYLISVAVEAAGASALQALVAAQNAVANHQIDSLAEALQCIDKTMKNVFAILLRLHEKCDPYIYYNRVRHYIGSWPQGGVIYEGVSQTPLFYVGSSAAQSPLFQAIDAGLGIEHNEAESAYFQKVRPYMKLGHRRFIQFLEAGPSVRAYVQSNQMDYPALCDAYNACVNMLDLFRKKHLEIATEYIARQAPSQVNKVKTGTGGTLYTHFLSQVDRTTQKHVIKQAP